MKNNLKTNVVIIGGGPAGMMAAIFAAKNGAKTLILEKNEKLGKKLLLTGKGRCNITSSCKEVKDLVSAFGDNGKFLYSCFNQFDNHALINFFSESGLKTKTERGNRIFPTSDKASEVLEILIKQLNKYGVKVITKTEIKDISFKNKNFQIALNNSIVTSNKLIICTGGVSYPETGSCGDGYKWGKKFGHKIEKIGPALVPIVIKEHWIKKLQGLSLKNVKISVYKDNKKIDERTGEAIFTHNGISGPIILDMSKKISQNLEKNLELRIDFKPALDYQTLDKRIMRDFNEFKNKALKNSLQKLMPKKLIPLMIELTEIDENKKCAEIRKEERKKLLNLLKNFKLKISGVEDIIKSIVTSGGINLNEINPKTMESKIIPGLFFAGEILNIDAVTGGFNLQGAWSTGYVAGINAACKK